MTTIAYRDGIIAADSRMTTSTDGGGDRYRNCQKIFHKHGHILVTYGDAGPDVALVEWYNGKRRKPPADLRGSDFGVLVLSPRGLELWDGWGVEALDPAMFYAFGSGEKAAMGAMYMKATAIEAVEVAAFIDPWTGGPIHSAHL